MALILLSIAANRWCVTFRLSRPAKASPRMIPMNPAISIFSKLLFDTIFIKLPPLFAVMPEFRSRDLEGHDAYCLRRPAPGILTDIFQVSSTWQSRPRASEALAQFTWVRKILSGSTSQGLRDYGLTSESSRYPR